MTNFTSSLRPQAIEVRPVVLRRLAAAGTLDVDDPDDLGGHVVDAAMPAGLEHHRVPVVEQPLHQRIDVRLQQRLAAGDLDERAAVSARTCGDHLVDDILRPSWKAYGVSHHEQRRSQAVSRTNTHGRPAWVDSPWIE